MTSSSSNKIIRNKDLIALKNYIVANDSTQYDTLSSGTIILDITHSNLKQRHIELRFDLHCTLDTLRDRIYRQTGTFPAYQHLSFIDSGVKILDIPPNTDNNRMIGYYNLHHGVTVHVTDLDEHSASRNGGYEDTSLIQKYRMSEEEYNKRKGTLRSWTKEQMEKDKNFTLARHAREHRELMDAVRLVKQGLSPPKGFEIDRDGKVVRCVVENDEEKVNNNASLSSASVPGKETVDGHEVGMRCEVQPGARRGVIQFIGEITNLSTGGYWVGVQFDEPVGKTDGSAKGKKYFDALPGFGGFIRGTNVQAGDFPERDIFDDDDDDSEDEI